MNFSYWEKQFIPDHADLIIIGSGITGLSAAYHTAIRHPKWRIIVLEQFVRSNAASTRNAGFACFGSAGELIDDLNQGISKTDVLSTVEKRLKGLTLLRKTLGDQSLAYEKCGGMELFDSSQETEFYDISNRLDELNLDLKHLTGLEQTFEICNLPKSLIGFQKAINNRLEGKLNPGFMMSAWTKKCQDHGIEIFTGMKAQLLEDHSGVLVSNHRINADQIAVCTNGLSKDLNLELPIQPARNLVLLTKPIPHLELPSTYHHLQGFMYFRKIHQRLLLGGGRHKFKTQESTDQFMVNTELRNHLEAYLLRHFNIAPDLVELEWTGIMGVGGSKKPLVDRLNENLVYGVKLGGMGVAIGSLVGKEISELL